MDVKLVVALTDSGWYRFLSNLNSERKLEDVNFWQPPASKGMPIGFRSLKRGELFLFHVKDASGQRKIAGGGVFLSYLALPCSYAWKIFGQTNGAGSLAEMKASILTKSSAVHRKEDFLIGCRVLAEPIFLPREHWFAPPGWKKGIQSYKTYDTATEDGRRLWEMYVDACTSVSPGSTQRFDRPQTVQPRLGLGAFRADIFRVYDQQCAVTSERALPVLEAAHIQSHSRYGSHEASNGLLLCSDLHDLFDWGYATVHAERNMLRFLVSKQIEEAIGNGREYRTLHGTEIRLPREERFRPSPRNLRWHNDYVFLG